MRVKFINALRCVNSGALFIPTDTTVLGSGLALNGASAPYLQNRTTVHLHGSNTPWISDGTPHQWTVPAVDWNNRPFTRRDSVSFVPEMFLVNGLWFDRRSAVRAVINGTTCTTNCSDSSGTHYATTLPAGATTNNQAWAPSRSTTRTSRAPRLLFYHDHSYGTTRLNVYAGEASGYVIRDNVEADLVGGTNNWGVFMSAGICLCSRDPFRRRENSADYSGQDSCTAESDVNQCLQRSPVGKRHGLHDSLGCLQRGLLD